MECRSTQIARDRAYWNDYYTKGLCPSEPSAFAEYVLTLVEPYRVLVDLGCGNGRDALFFAQNHLDVIAIDLSDSAIAALHTKSNGEIKCLLDDFVNCAVHQDSTYDYAYSRFTLHAISKDQGSVLIKNVFLGLRPGGKFFIEVRGTKDPLFGLGEQIGENTFVYDGHSRRFLVLDELVAELAAAGFLIEYAKEQTGFAVYQAHDPPMIRVIAVKPADIRGEEKTDGKRRGNSFR